MGHTIVDRLSWGILWWTGSDGAYYSGQALMWHTIEVILQRADSGLNAETITL